MARRLGICGVTIVQLVVGDILFCHVEVNVAVGCRVGRVAVVVVDLRSGLLGNLTSVIAGIKRVQGFAVELSSSGGSDVVEARRCRVSRVASDGHFNAELRRHRSESTLVGSTDKESVGLHT